MPELIFEPVLPDKPFDPEIYIQEWSRALRTETKPKLQRLFELTVAGWEERPDFPGPYNRYPDRLELFVHPGGRYKDIYELVVRGAPAHPIAPRKPGGRLRFQPGYSPATARGRLQSRRARSYGALVSARVVKHPGFEGREFDELIAEYHRPKFIEDMNAATERANRRQ